MGGGAEVANPGASGFLSAYRQTSYFTGCCRFPPLPNSTLAKISATLANGKPHL
jgi:hypothetical protein